MANYKIATINFLKSKGWLISSSYDGRKCVTYQEVTSTIPVSGDIEVNVNSTITGTSRSYTNSQLVCESDINIESQQDCTFECQDSIRVATTATTGSVWFNSFCNNTYKDIEIVSIGTLSTASVRVTDNTGGYIDFTYRISAISQTSITIRQTDTGIEKTITVYIDARIDVHLVTAGLPSNLVSGSLDVTGSTYSINFPLAGPNANSATTLQSMMNYSDSRTDMNFQGRFDRSEGGGNIWNSCSGHEVGLNYTVNTASWNSQTRTLNVTINLCS